MLVRRVLFAAFALGACALFVHGNDSSLLPEHPRSAGVSGPFSRVDHGVGLTEPAAPAPIASEPAPSTEPPVIVEPMSPQTTNPPAPTGLEPCGGSLPPCSVKYRESHGDYSAVNLTGCGGHGCFGAWQFSGEWAGKLGLPLDIANATPAQQDEAARELWNGGAGCGNWASCG